MQCKDRISMEKQKQIELLLERGYSRRKIAESLKLCRRTVRRYAQRFQLRAAEEKERPKHKASVESAAGLLQRVFYPKVRNTTFTSLRQLNEAIKLFVEQLNNEIMKEYGVSRNERFMQEQPLLKPLPAKKFEFAEWKTLKVHPDCHIQCCRSFYSIPWQHVGREVRVKVTDSTVEVFDIAKLERIVVHARSKIDYKRVTNIEHYPAEKAAAASFTIEVAKKQALRIGPNMEALLHELFSQSHPLRYLRPVQGWIRLYSSERHSKGAVEYAASMALKHSKFGTKYFKTCADHFDRSGTDTDSNVSKLCPKRNNIHSYLQNKN